MQKHPLAPFFVLEMVEIVEIVEIVALVQADTNVDEVARQRH